MLKKQNNKKTKQKKSQGYFPAKWEDLQSELANIQQDSDIFICPEKITKKWSSLKICGQNVSDKVKQIN